MDNMPGMKMPAPNQNVVGSEKPAMGLHGMLIIGEETIYVSHLPMWMRPHNFQVILEVTFMGSDQPQARYVDDHKTSRNETVYFESKRGMGYSRACSNWSATFAESLIISGDHLAQSF